MVIILLQECAYPEEPILGLQMAHVASGNSNEMRKDHYDER